MGKRGVYTISSGIKIAYLSGIEGTENWEYSKEDVMALRNSCHVSKTIMGDYRGIDVLLTSQWPEAASDVKEENCSKLISWLALQIKPRYHFCGLNGKFYERPPYRNQTDQTTQYELATRFIAMANVGNSDKSKYIYALNIQPVDKMRVIELIQKTTNETECPYNQLNFREDKAIPGNEDDSSQYFYDMKNYQSGDGHGRHKKRQRPNFDVEKCWFCLASPNVEKHLIISIGENFYLALAKGPLNDTHILILSVTHIQSASLLSNDDWIELEKFKKALTSFYESQNQSVCFFERNYKSAHLQINAVGVDSKIDWQLKHVFEDKGEEYNLNFETIPKLTEASQLPEHGAYFAAELPDNSTLISRQMKYFPLHFGREVLCAPNLLNCEEKADWRECTITKDEEISLVKEFREKFKKFDFTL